MPHIGHKGLMSAERVKIPLRAILLLFIPLRIFLNSSEPNKRPFMGLLRLIKILRQKIMNTRPITHFHNLRSISLYS